MGYERAVLGITLKDRKRNDRIRQKLRVEDNVQMITKQAWNLTGHVAKMTEERWLKKFIQWIHQEGKRHRARSNQRWIDDIKIPVGSRWFYVAHDRETFRGLRKAFVEGQRLYREENKKKKKTIDDSIKAIK